MMHHETHTSALCLLPSAVLSTSRHTHTLAAARLDSFGLKQEQIRGVEGSTHVPLDVFHHQAGGMRVRHVRRVARVEHDVCEGKRKQDSDSSGTTNSSGTSAETRRAHDTRRCARVCWGASCSVRISAPTLCEATSSACGQPDSHPRNRRHGHVQHLSNLVRERPAVPLRHPPHSRSE
jgi:hypothetical protein